MKRTTMIMMMMRKRTKITIKKMMMIVKREGKIHMLRNFFFIEISEAIKM